MAHWAEVDKDNIVVRVLVTDNNDPNGDEGYQWLIDNFGGTWVKTSYNAVGGKRRNPETGEITEEIAFRKNYAGIGYVWDQGKDAFIPPKPFNSWILNEETCMWEPPVALPDYEKTYIWNEDLQSWEEVLEIVSE